MPRLHPLPACAAPIVPSRESVQHIRQYCNSHCRIFSSEQAMNTTADLVAEGYALQYGIIIRDPTDLVISEAMHMASRTKSAACAVFAKGTSSLAGLFSRLNCTHGLIVRVW